MGFQKHFQNSIFEGSKVPIKSHEIIGKAHIYSFVVQQKRRAGRSLLLYEFALWYKASLTTKKYIECKAIIQKHSKDFGGSLEDPDVIKLCGCSRNSYYKYKRELKTTF